MGRGKVIKSLQREIIIKVKKIIIINIMKYWKKGILDVCMRTASYCPQIVYNQGDTTKGTPRYLKSVASSTCDSASASAFSLQ